MLLWSSCQIVLQRDVANFHPHSLKNWSVFVCFLWAETLKHLSLWSNLAINPCLITLSDNLYLMNSEKTQSTDVSHLFFSKHILFVFNSQSDIHILLKGCHSSLCFYCLRLVE